jgi:hypothetical protein
MRGGLATLSLALCTVTAACGGGVQGEYLGKDGETFFNSLTFRSDGKVEIVFVGAKHEGTYEVDDGAVTMTAPNGDKTLLRPNAEGCLTNSLIGTYCKGRRGASSDAPAPAAASSNAPGAEVYEARARDGQIRLEFGAARKARITMVPTGIADAPERMSFDVSYAVDGDRVTVNLPGNEPLMLTRAGGDLEGTMNGETVRFVKR